MAHYMLLIHPSEADEAEPAAWQPAARYGAVPKQA
jgi:hypothetical protein